MSAVLDFIVNYVTISKRSIPKSRFAVGFRGALSAAMHSLPWKPDDWTKLNHRYAVDSRHLFGDHRPLGADQEWAYTRFCELGESAGARSFEQWAGRKRFPLPPPEEWGGAVKGLQCLRVGLRLRHIGTGHWCAVTSLNAERAVLCAYTDVPHPRDRQVLRRFTLQHPDAD